MILAEMLEAPLDDFVALLHPPGRVRAWPRTNRSIQQMTELMPTDKLMNSAEVVRKRESEKKKVETLRQEWIEDWGIRHMADDAVTYPEEYSPRIRCHQQHRYDTMAFGQPT